MNKALFEYIESAPPNKKYLVTVSYLEVWNQIKLYFFFALTFVLNFFLLQIYQEVIYDLLNPHGKDMKIRQHPQFGM